MTPDMGFTSLPEKSFDWLRQWSVYTPNAIAFKDIESGVDYSYFEMNQIAGKLANWLRFNKKIKFADRVACLSSNEIEMVFLFFACIKLGAIFVPINFRLMPREIDHILSDSGASLLVVHPDFENRVNQLKCKPKQIEKLVGPDGIMTYFSEIDTADEINSRVTMSTPCMILYTSGTTGSPKGVVVDHKMLYWNSINTSLRLNINQQDVTLCFLPLFHTGGWNVLLTPFIHKGAKLLFLKKFDETAILKLCEIEKVSILFGVPTTMEMMSRNALFNTVDFKSVRYAIVGGEPMPLPAIEKWHEKGVPIRQGYGLTEFGPNVFSLNEEDAIRKIGSVGFPNFYIDARVVDENGNELSANEIGELILRGPMAMPCYWQNDDATKQTIKDGWLYTGDLVRKDQEGYFYVVGRKKDMFISGGENVYPAEVEQFLVQMQGVREVALIGVADEKWGEVGKAFVVCEKGVHLKAEDILNYCNGQLAKFKIPRYFEFLSELPKGDSGKILKRELK